MLEPEARRSPLSWPHWRNTSWVANHRPELTTTALNAIAALCTCRNTTESYACRQNDGNEEYQASEHVPSPGT